MEGCAPKRSNYYYNTLQTTSYLNSQNRPLPRRQLLLLQKRQLSQLTSKGRPSPKHSTISEKNKGCKGKQCGKTGRQSSRALDAELVVEGCSEEREHAADEVAEKGHCAESRGGVEGVAVGAHVSESRGMKRRDSPIGQIREGREIDEAKTGVEDADADAGSHPVQSGVRGECEDENADGDADSADHGVVKPCFRSFSTDVSMVEFLAVVIDDENDNGADNLRREGQS